MADEARDVMAALAPCSYDGKREGEMKRGRERKRERDT